jgi:fumarate reductase subunit D
MFKDPATKDRIDALQALELTALDRPELKGVGFDFEEAANTIKDMVSFLAENSRESEHIVISRKAENYLREVSENLNTRIIPSIFNFIVKDNPNASNEYQSITDNLHNVEATFIETTEPLLTKIQLNKISTTSSSEEIESIRKIKKESEEILSSLKKEKESAEKIVKTARDASGIKASEISSSIFLEQAGEHSDLADKWFKWVVGLFGVLFLVFILVFNGWWPFGKFSVDKVKGDNFLLVHAVIFKLLILSSVYFVLHQAIKNYKINKHLYVVNKHKHNALSVYPTILNAGDDAETRTSIASQAAKSIFEQIPTGYLEGDDDPRPVNPTSVITKIIDRKS